MCAVLFLTPSNDCREPECFARDVWLDAVGCLAAQIESNCLEARWLGTSQIQFFCTTWVGAGGALALSTLHLVPSCLGSNIASGFMSHQLRAALRVLRKRYRPGDLDQCQGRPVDSSPRGQCPAQKQVFGSLTHGVYRFLCARQPAVTLNHIPLPSKGRPSVILLLIEKENRPKACFFTVLEDQG